MRTVVFPKQVWVCAHRGAEQYAPENTLAAFRKAVELGADFVEIDVRKTKDGVNMILHDSSLGRTTGAEGKIEDWNSADLAALSAGKWFAAEFEQERVPTLEEACRTVKEANERLGRSAALYVDCKNPDLEAMIATLKKYDFLKNSVFYGSDERLLAVRELAPEARLMPSLGKAEEMDEKIERLKPFAFDANWKIVSKDLIDKAHEAGVKIFSDNPFGVTVEDLREKIELGIDAIQTHKLLSVYQAENETARR